MSYLGYTLSGLLAAAIIFIGVRFHLDISTASQGYGVPTPPNTASQRQFQAYCSIKGLRDIVSGLTLGLLMINGTSRLVSQWLVIATLIPLGDMMIVLRAGGTPGVAYGVHGSTAAVMLLTAWLMW